jgi:hypothetical protein
MEAQKKRSYLTWQVSGFAAIAILGALLHFTYEWSGFNPIVGLFSSVNESVWEHFKLGFTALLLFSIVEYPFIGAKNPRYFLAKAMGILSLQIFITVFYYSYTMFTGDDILWIDIVSYILGSALCQLVVFRVLTDEVETRVPQFVGIGLLVIHAALLFVFTFWTPKRSIFLDTNTNTYGTEWRVDPGDRLHDHDEH